MPSALAERVSRLCRVDLSAKRLRESILSEIRTAMPFTGHVFTLTDPVTAVASAPLADLPGLDFERLPDLIRARYLTVLNRWDTLRGTGAHSLLGATGGDPGRSLLWRTTQRGLGVTDSAILAFADRYGCWGFLELLRFHESPFTTGELADLGELTASITAALRHTVAATFIESDTRLPDLGPAVVLLDDTLRVRSQTAAAAASLLRLLPPDEPIPPVPASVYNAGAALLAAEAGTPIGPASARIHLGGRRWITVKADRIGPHDIAVALEPSTAAERLDLFARANGLSARESQVLTLLATGLDSHELAAELFLSEHTVNDHVKAILGKSGTRTRQRLLSRVLGVD
ncbi:helix-turn-helix transcriptional regulator [Nocardia mangyaensis]|uniref:helix-turn-helix transcriptional regulator n=1 Tax=Nocardia mangyaensis TaxID=2213200 RepID=UPI0026748CFD|nr:helix-turn-helix transcriptional regulator [Nocardia mangyaensis]MDO3649192.1 helix-turn-helix transcriptional regulator [Nocardia mangyaensis]